MRLRDVQHQQRALSLIQRGLASGRAPHAYLFEGPEGVGKELTARALAARLLCAAPDESAEGEACGQCQSCRMFARDNHPDFHLIYRGLHKLHPDRNVRVSKGLFLGVDLIRHFLIEPSTSKPTVGRRHVFVIRDAERMNEEAQNALLKTLEEPPGETCLILVTASADRLLPTIRSRCQRISFGLLPPDYVHQRLKGEGVGPDSADALTRLCDGRLGAALRWHRIGLMDALPGVLDSLTRALKNDPEAFAAGMLEAATELAARDMQAGDDEEESDETADEGRRSSPRTKSTNVPTDQLRDALKLTLLLLAAFYRDALISQHQTATPLNLPPLQERSGRLAKFHTADELDAALTAINRAERMLDQNVAPQLVGERLAAALNGAAPVP